MAIRSHLTGCSEHGFERQLKPHCFSFMSGTVLNIPTKSNVGEVYLAYNPRLQSITAGESRQELDAAGDVHSQKQRE